MKKIIGLVILQIAFSSLAVAVNLQSFHGKNFQAIANHCGLHVEVTGDRVVLTNIVPPNVPPGSMVCGAGIWRNCNHSFMLTCTTNGECSNDNGEMFTLMSDGNMFSHRSGVKFIRTQRTSFEWCQ